MRRGGRVEGGGVLDPYFAFPESWDEVIVASGLDHSPTVGQVPPFCVYTWVHFSAHGSDVRGGGRTATRIIWKERVDDELFSESYVLLIP